MPFAGHARHVSTRLLTSLTFVLVAYAYVQSAAPILDHDLVCHLKSRTHCTICATGVFAPGLNDAAAPPPVRHLPCAGAIELDGERMIVPPTLSPTQNRAPPA